MLPREMMETYGQTLVEAMAFGTPVVVFRVGGIPEAALEGEGAILSAAQDAMALVQAVMKLRDSKQLRETLWNAGYEVAPTRDELDSFAHAFTRVYEECLQPGKTPSLADRLL